jgi:hypothetical protein
LSALQYKRRRSRKNRVRSRVTKKMSSRELRAGGKEVGAARGGEARRVEEQEGKREEEEKQEE